MPPVFDRARDRPWPTDRLADDIAAARRQLASASPNDCRGKGRAPRPIHAIT
jgi:hypothetical protein